MRHKLSLAKEVMTVDVLLLIPRACLTSPSSHQLVFLDSTCVASFWEMFSYPFFILVSVPPRDLHGILCKYVFSQICGITDNSLRTGNASHCFSIIECNHE